MLQHLHALHAHSSGVQVVIMADGQVTRGNEIVKPNVTKVRRLNDSVISGFAGGVLEQHTVMHIASSHSQHELLTCTCTCRRYSRCLHFI